MLRFGNDLLGVNVSSIDSSRIIAVVIDVLLNPNDLSVAALICNKRSSGEDLYLLPQDIHDYTGPAITVQNEEALTQDEDMIKLRDVITINFKLVGKRVISDSKRKVGKVTEYVIDDETFKIMKIHAKPIITKLLKSSDLIISRTQIVELNDKEVVVRESTVKNSRFVQAGADI